MEKKYLNLLAKMFPTILSAQTEIINLSAILNLPKGTEHFLSDLHGEHEVFLHILKNASGVLRRKIDEVFGGEMSDPDKGELAALIYYPTHRLELLRTNGRTSDGWYAVTIHSLVRVARAVAVKYTRSKVKKAMTSGYSYILDELIYTYPSEDKDEYLRGIVDAIVREEAADTFIIAICNLMHRLAIDHLHIIGDIFDRGEGADLIIDRLISYHSLDIQWGNHDILWMGAYCGNLACIANVIRICTGYNNLKTLENAYGISLMPLAIYAAEKYDEDIGGNFKLSADNFYGIDNQKLLTNMYKAITLIQLRLENALIKKHPEYGMDDRVLYGGDVLDEKETEIMQYFASSFRTNKRLKQHIMFLYEKGSLYKVYNGNLLMHGCVPTNADGSFTEVEVEGEKFSGKPLYDKLDKLARRATDRADVYAVDYMWYMWSGRHSPLYGRDKMGLYEKYILGKTVRENKDAYYEHVQKKEYCMRVLAEFGLSGKCGHIINGHMPVMAAKGEKPVSAGGLHITIDGGLAKPYHSVTGIAGYTLICNSHGLILVEHSPFGSRKEAIEKHEDLVSRSTEIERFKTRRLIKDTDVGKDIIKQIEGLSELIAQYRSG